MGKDFHQHVSGIGKGDIDVKCAVMKVLSHNSSTAELGCIRHCVRTLHTGAAVRLVLGGVPTGAGTGSGLSGAGVVSAASHSASHFTLDGVAGLRVAGQAGGRFVPRELSNVTRGTAAVQKALDSCLAGTVIYYFLSLNLGDLCC